MQNEGLDQVICGTDDIMDSRLFTFLSTATEKLENQNESQRESNGNDCLVGKLRGKPPP